MLYYCRFFLFLIFCFLPFYNEAAFSSPAHVKAELVAEEETIQPGRPFWLAVHLNIEDDWHVYWKNPGDAGTPLKVEWILPVGFKADSLQWPFPEKFTLSDMVGYGYQGDVVLLARLLAPENLSLDQPIELKADITWLVCSDANCQPGSAIASLKLKTGVEVPVLRSEAAVFFKNARAKIPTSHAEIKTVQKEGVVLTAEIGDILLAVTLGPDCFYLGAAGVLRPGERLEAGSMCLLHLG